MVKTARTYVLASSDNSLFPSIDKTSFYVGTQGSNKEYNFGRGLQFIMPNGVQQINPNNNTFSFTEETGNLTLTITITSGTYVNTSFEVLLKSLMDAESLANGNSLVYTVSVNQNTGKLTISTSANFRINDTNSKEITGFMAQTNFSTSHTSTETLNLTPIDTILVHGIGSNLYNTIERTQDDIFMIVPIAQYPFGGYIQYEPRYPIIFPSPKSDQLFIKITDEFSRDVFMESSDGLKILLEFFD